MRPTWYFLMHQLENSKKLHSHEIYAPEERQIRKRVESLSKNSLNEIS